MKKALIWFRNDLRLADNEALNYAYKNNYEILFLYICDKNYDLGAASKWFLHQALNSLQISLQEKYNAKLVIKSGNVTEILTRIIADYNIDLLVWNRCYEPQIIARDTKIKSLFKAKNTEVKTFNSTLLFEPFAIKNLQGSYFKVFTPFWKKCLSLINNISEPCKMAENLSIVELKNNESLNLEELNLLPKNPNWAKDWDSLYRVSEDQAHNIAQNFIANKITNYKQARDFPAQDDTSKLSAYLHFGLISPKQIYYKTIFLEASEGLKHFLSELGWREFSYHLLYNFPTLNNDNFKAKFDNFPWQNNSQDIKKWQEGKTGFPIIDAGMRQLYKTGWMHNRVRMIVASFLTKNLLVDWRIGAKWFWDCLVDADLAANSASWQWVAGSGADAAPYFRIFNPITQSQKFDPNGAYIRKWVPEIANLSDQEIHFPNNRNSYFKPMVDLSFSRNRALQIYKEL